MEPAYDHACQVRIDPFPYLWASPQRGDVVALRCPEAKDRIELKRVVGLPGEHVSWVGNHIWVNGAKLKESVARGDSYTPGDAFQIVDLGPGEYFVAGDNRPFSRDSRAYGPVWLSDILGKAVDPSTRTSEGRIRKQTLESHTLV